MIKKSDEGDTVCMHLFSNKWILIVPKKQKMIFFFVKLKKNMYFVWSKGLKTSLPFWGIKKEYV